MYYFWQYCLSSDTVTSAKCHYFACLTFCKQAFLSHKSLVDICKDCLDTLKWILIRALENLAIGIKWYWHLNWPFLMRLIFVAKYSQIWRLVNFKNLRISLPFAENAHVVYHFCFLLDPRAPDSSNLKSTLSWWSHLITEIFHYKVIAVNRPLHVHLKYEIKMRN